MSRFTAPVELTPVHGGWGTTRAFGFYLGDTPGQLSFVVPKGTLTDLGSIPPLLWPILPRDDPRFVAAFVGHDYLCNIQGLPRFTAAAIFLEMLIVLARVHRAPMWRVYAMAAGVTVWALVSPRD